MTGEERSARLAAAILELSKMLDLVGYKSVIGKRTRFGKRPGPDPWSYTRVMFAEYAPGKDPDEFVRIFQGLGIENEVRACVFLTVNDKLVP